MVIDIVQTALSACDGIEFSNLADCPSCGGDVRGYDMRKKQFAAIIENGKKRIIHIRVKRFYCKSCKRLFDADEPFYPDTRIGSPVIDLCVTFAATIPFTRTATYLSLMGIVIDRGSVRNYANRYFGEIPTADIFGMHLPLSILSISSLAASASEGSGIIGAEVLAACGFPSAHRAAPHPLSTGKNGEQRQEHRREKRTGHRALIRPQ
jgi:predicted nucleic-acid-binding Zn-ribbon protein